MFFCSHCGFLLPPGSTQCPRCGTAVNADKGAVNLSPDAPTTQSAVPGAAQQADYRTSPSLDNTPFVIQNNAPSPSNNMQTSPPLQPVRSSVPPVSGQPSQDYPQAGVPVYNLSTQNPPQPISPYPGFPTTDHPELISQTPWYRNTGLISAITTFLLVFVIATALLITTGPERILGLLGRQATPTTPIIIVTAISPTPNGTQATPSPVPTVTTTTTTPTPNGTQATPSPVPTVTTTATTPTPSQTTPSPVPTVTATTTPPSTTTAEQQSQSVIEQYYTAINRKDYQTAYNLWANNSQSYDDFVQGFAHTKRDDVVFDRLARQPDGTVQVFITLTATSDTGATSLYRGYYLVGQQADSTWKIITAQINQA